MPERYFVFTCCRVNTSTRASAGKKTNFDLCVCACARSSVSRPFSPLIIVFALVLALILAHVFVLVLASVVKSRLNRQV